VTGARCEVCVTSVNGVGVSNLRGFDAESGQLLWEVLNFLPIGKSPDGSVFGYRWNKEPQSYGYVGVAYVPMFSGAAVISSGTALQKKTDPAFNTRPAGEVYVAKCLRVGINGGQTIIMSEAGRSMGPADYAAVLPPATDTMGLYPNYNDSSSQLYNCTNDGLILGKTSGIGISQVGIEVTDLHRQVHTHQIRMYPRAIFPTGTGTASWVLVSGGVTIRFGLYATAVDIQTAIATLPTVASVSVTGGPTCQERVDIQITFHQITDRIEHCAVEYVSNSNPPASPLAANVSIWTLAGHKPLIPQGLKTLTANIWSFAFGGDGILGSGEWGPFTGLVNKTAWSKLLWTMPATGTVPLWGSISGRAWDVLAFDGKTQTTERRWVATAFGTELDSVPIVRAITAVYDSQVAITSTSCRPPTLDGGVAYQTHLIVNESSGAIISSGWSGLLDSTRLMFGPDGDQYRYGGRKRYLSSTYSTSSHNLQTSPYAEPNYVESSGTHLDSDDLRESDVPNAYAIGSKLISIEPGHSQTFFSTATTAEFFSPTLPNVTHRQQKESVWLGTTVSGGSDATYPFGFYKRDTYQILSAFTRYSASTEWRLLHGNRSGFGFSFTSGRSTNWLASNVSLADVRTELNDWYGAVSSGGRDIVRVNPFGDDPFLEGLTPPIPTWQKLELSILRDGSGTPNALSPLAPVGHNTLLLQLRNITPIRTHGLCGLDKSTGVIVWQRDIGKLLQPSGGATNAGGFPMAFANNVVVVRTACQPGKDIPVFSRGDT